ncbi:hypothetical protein J5X98_05115 [Leptothermofonsia sichuanensis E412]|uniref:hypothetical protein n=1 Tax=Leptothermofonsia sichuanensis TaxID=2917832 RepID=UPI001CA67412|nr:hypothetical protein [Leptothermofonsia sichuanensis]QZZ21819.1 hypothetical protein J5X98_05115 [Leptothermofonsia sichuanensis E412]
MKTFENPDLFTEITTDEAAVIRGGRSYYPGYRYYPCGNPYYYGTYYDDYGYGYDYMPVYSGYVYSGYYRGSRTMTITITY